MEYQPPRSQPRPIPRKNIMETGYVLKTILEPAQISLNRDTTRKATDTPTTLPIRYAKPM